MKKDTAQDPDPIKQTPSQIDPYLARPEDFPVRQYCDPIAEPYHGQATNDPEAERKSYEQFNRGSVRAKGNIDHAGPPHTKVGTGA